MFLSVLTGMRLIFLTARFRNREFGHINHFRASRDQKFEDGAKRRKVEMLNQFFAQYEGNWNLALPEVDGENVITVEVLR